MPISEHIGQQHMQHIRFMFQLGVLSANPSDFDVMTTWGVVKSEPVFAEAFEAFIRRTLGAGQGGDGSEGYQFSYVDVYRALPPVEQAALLERLHAHPHIASRTKTA